MLSWVTELHVEEVHPAEDWQQGQGIVGMGSGELVTVVVAGTATQQPALCSASSQSLDTPH